MSADEAGSTPPLHERFGYLLKHAWERLSALTAEALREYGISGRELAVLSALAQGEPPSQLGAAQRLGVDRTTMVLLIDGLEAKALVERRTDPSDRRRNIVVLTAAGKRTLGEASVASDKAERNFLESLPEADRAHLRAMLHAISGIGADAVRSAPGAVLPNAGKPGRGEPA